MSGPAPPGLPDALAALQLRPPVPPPLVPPSPQEPRPAWNDGRSPAPAFPTRRLRRREFERAAIALASVRRAPPPRTPLARFAGSEALRTLRCQTRRLAERVDFHPGALQHLGLPGREPALRWSPALPTASSQARQLEHGRQFTHRSRCEGPVAVPPGLRRDPGRRPPPPRSADRPASQLPFPALPHAGPSSLVTGTRGAPHEAAPASEPPDRPA
jgi:hypothetical protein